MAVKKSAYVSFWLAVMMSAILAYGASASAGWFRINGNQCGGNTNVLHSNAGLTYYGSSPTGDIYCAAPDDSAHPASGSVAVVVYYDDGSTVAGVWAQTCVNFYNSIGTACSGITNNGTISDVKTGSLTLSSSAWASNPSDFKWVQVSLPGVDAGRQSSLLGYTISY